MKRLVILLSLILCYSIIIAQNNSNMSYTMEWEKVTALEKQSLPQSAANAVDKILQKAIADKNSPQVVKALIHKGKYDIKIDSQNDSALFNNLNEMLAMSTDVVEKAVLNSMLGELYMMYYQNDQFVINQRTALEGFIPEDMKEWPRNLLYDKVVEHLNASLNSRDELEKTDVDKYEEVVIMGGDSRRFYPTMYDFLAKRAIDTYAYIITDEDLSVSLAKKNIPEEKLFSSVEEFITLNFNAKPKDYNLWALETFKKLMISLSERKMEKSLVLTELDKLNYLGRLNNAYNTYAEPSIEKLYHQWENNEFSVEIVNKIVDLNNRSIARLDGAGKEAKIKENYDLLNKTINAFPDYEHTAILENSLSRIIQPELLVSGKNSFPIKGKKELTVKYKNLNTLKVQLYKMESSLVFAMMQMGTNDYNQSKQTFVKEFQITLPDKPEYLSAETTFEIPIEKPGSYVLKLSADKPFTQQENIDFYFVVTDLAVFSRIVAQNKYEFFVVDRITGEPVPGANIEIYKLPGSWRNSKLTLEQTIPVNKQGLAVYNKDIDNKDVFYHAVLKNDNGSLLSNLPNTFYQFNDNITDETTEEVTIFTDRSLYRPGQIVYFKAIVIQNNKQKKNLVPNKSIDLSLFDVNGQELTKQTLTTNEYGSVTGEFVLPQGLLTGGFSIRTANGSVFFNVEEYKRPTFDVTFDKIDQTYKFGEEIKLKGKAVSYSGVKLQQATVSYRITRQQMWWRFWGGNPEHFAQGVAATDQNGTFEIKFTPEKTNAANFGRTAYTFTIEATITDVNGESQVGRYTVNVGDISMMLEVELPDGETIEKSTMKPLGISAKNLDGNDIEAKGMYRVFSLLENDSINKDVLNGDFVTGEQVGLSQSLAKLPSGKYRIKLESQDDRNNRIESEKDFILFSFADKKPPVKTNNWVVIKNKNYSKSTPAEMIFGASEKINLLYEVWQENNLLERKWISLNNENKRFTFQNKAEYKKSIRVIFTYVKEENFYTNAIDLNHEKMDKKLDVKLSVFRDKIRPGSAEEWMVTVNDAENKPAMAEVLASMYDYSLEKLFPTQDWDLNLLNFKPYSYFNNFICDVSFYDSKTFGRFEFPYKHVESFMFDRFNWFGFYLNGNLLSRNVTVVAFGAQKKEMMVGRVAGNIKFEYAQDIQLGDGLIESKMIKGVSTPESAPSEANESQLPQIRGNFNETAFFFPQLRTNEQGETQIAFTVPESNTKWRFRVLAHDKDLNTGKAEAFTVSQKELMVTPNIPRFLRHGDRTSISTKISNLSEGALSGKVKLEFFDPVSEQLIKNIVIENQNQEFSLDKDASSNAAWSFDVPKNIDILGVRIVAQTESFSDGEQHALSVLPNKVLVTESVRMDLNGNQSKEYKMDRLIKNSASSSAQNYRLTLEFTSNAAWYAVQALPVLSNPDNDNSVSWFASFYANSLGYHISEAYPQVSAMIEAWKKQGGNKETFLSNLEKNQELKNVLLEETPWVMEAKDESDQKERLSLLFDLNRSQNLTSVAIDKLQELQTESGGWSWFKNFRPSVSITQYILYGFSQLNDLGVKGYSDKIWDMQAKGIAYIDEQALERFELLKKWNKDWKNIKTIPITDLEYLYVRSAYKQYALNTDLMGMVDFYTTKVEENWTKYGLYERSLISVLMNRNKQTSLEQAILKSFREHATVNEEMGMFWANNQSHVFMSQSAVSVHTFIMNAFLKGGANKNEMDNMKRWLLKQKQTQNWESTHATMDAIYALLSTGSDWFSISGETSIKLGNQVVEPENKELGTGYFKEAWLRSEIKPEMGNVSVNHKGNAPAWGALYLQYFEDADKVSKVDGSLDVEKLLFIEKIDESGRSLVPVTENTPMRVGDKVVVRLTIRTDRDIEFVHLKDMRAAAFEPVEQISTTRWQGGTIYYMTSKDASTNFYFDNLPRGTYVFEYGVYVNRTGNYSNGITTIQCMYAPEFTSHTEGIRINVKD